MPCKTAVPIAASCPTAPSGVRGKPVATPAGPTPVAGGIRMVGPATAAGAVGSEACRSTCSIGAAAIASRPAGAAGRLLASTLPGMLPVPPS